MGDMMAGKLEVHLQYAAEGSSGQAKYLGELGVTLDFGVAYQQSVTMDHERDAQISKAYDSEVNGMYFCELDVPVTSSFASN